MAYIKVRDKRTGQIVAIPEERFNPSNYEVPGQKQEQGFIGSLAAPFTRTGERVGGALETLLRGGLASASERALDRGDPQSVEMAQRLGELGGRPSKLTSGRAEELYDPKQLLKDSVAMLSYGIPAGGAGTSVAGRTFAPTLNKGLLAGGALAGFGYGEGETPGEMIRDAGVGAATGWGTGRLLNKFFKGGGAAKVGEGADDLARAKKPGALGRAGRSLEAESAGQRIGKHPTSILKRDEVLDWLRGNVPAGAPENQLYDVAAIYSDDYVTIGNALDNNPGPNLSKREVLSAIKQRVVEDGDQFIPGDNNYEKLLNKEISKIEKLSKGDTITSKEVYKAIGNLNQNLERAYAKKSGESGAALIAKEDVWLDVSTALHELLNVIGPEEIAPTMQNMHMAHLASKGLSISARDAANLFGVRIPGIAPALKSAESRIGRGLTRTDSALDDFMRGGVSRASEGAPAVSGKAATAAKGAAPEVAAGLASLFIGKDRTGQTPQQGMAGISQGAGVGEVAKETGGLDREALRKLALYDLQANDGKNITKIIALADFLDPQEDKTSDEKAGAEQRMNAAANALELLRSGSIKTGFIGGNLENLKSEFSMADPDTYRFNVMIDNIYAGIAKERGGTALTKEEKKLLNRYLPQSGDSRQQLAEKLIQLSTMDTSSLLSTLEGAR